MVLDNWTTRCPWPTTSWPARLSGNGPVVGAKNIAANVVPVAALFAYDEVSAVVFADGDPEKALWQ